jgi:hypothetical protein
LSEFSPAPNLALSIKEKKMKLPSFKILFFYLSFSSFFLLLFAQEYTEIEKRVLEGLNDTSWEVRQYAATILGQIRSKAAVAEIGDRLFKEENRIVMAEYCRTLGMIGDPRAEELILKILTAKHTAQIGNMINSGQMGKKELEAYEAKKQKEDAEFGELYCNALWSLGRIRSRKGVKTACAWAVTGKTPEIRRNAINALIEIQDPEALKLLSNALSKAKNTLLLPEEIEYRKNAFVALIEILPKFKQLQSRGEQPNSTTGSSASYDETGQNANFIYQKLFKLPRSFGELVQTDLEENSTHLWFQSAERGLFRVTLYPDGSFAPVVLEIGRFEDQEKKTEKESKEKEEKGENKK